jgi:hypothetical protein
VTRVRAQGLLIDQKSEHWHVSGPTVARLLKRAVSRLPAQPVRLGLVLHGIGELAARCDANLQEPLWRFVDHRRRFLPGKVLDAAFALSGHLAEPSRFATHEHGVAQTLLHATLSRETLDHGLTLAGRPHAAGGMFRYGWDFAVRLYARVNLAALDRWIARQQSADVRLAAIVSTLAEDLMWQAHSGDLARRLLKSRNPLLKCLAAAAVIDLPLHIEPRKTYAQCYGIFRETGLDAGDATWIAAEALKQIVHRRYRVADRLPQIEARRQYLGVHPEGAMGGAAHLAHELDRLDREETELRAANIETATALETALDDIARGWPTEGLIGDQLRWLDAAFVETCEIRHRLAIKLPPSPNRDALLDANIRQMKDALGLFAKLPEVFGQHFNGGANGLVQTLWWSAHSHVARYADDPRGIGRLAGITLEKLVTAGEQLIDQPFVASRQFERWSSAVGRLTCCHLWALFVVAATPATHAVQTDHLRKMAIEHTASLFRSAGSVYHDQGDMMGRLALTVVDYLGEDVALGWAFDAALPDYLRVLAAWGWPKAVRDHPELATDLFAGIAEHPLSMHGRDRQINRLVTFVDWIVARAWKRQDQDCIAHLTSAWSSCRHNWTDVLTGPLLDAPSWFWTALREDGASRTQLLADGRFAKTACVSQLKQAEAA